MRVLVCGGRDYHDWEYVHRLLDEYHELDNGEPGWITEIIHGGATGADQLAGIWAREQDVPVTVFTADWAKDGLAAGPIRNQRMIDWGKPDFAIALPGGRGTADMVNRLQSAGIRTYVAPGRFVASHA